MSANEIILGLLEAAKLSTIEGKYKGLAPGTDGRIRTVLSPSGTETGRLSSSTTFLEPSTNLQNQPKKTAKLNPLYDTRAVLIADEGRILLEADYSSAERRLLAYLANERSAIRMIEEGVNAYKWFCGQLYEIEDWKNIDKHKDLSIYHVGKTCILALDRGVGWKKLQMTINGDVELTGATITAKKAKAACELFHQNFPGYRRYFKEVESEIRDRGFLVNCCGRRRDFMGRRGNQAAWDSLVREGVSFLAQAVGDIINDRICRIYRKYDPEQLHLLLQIHDAILFDSSRENAAKACRLVKSEMERPIQVGKHSIVIPAEFSKGQRWSEMVGIEV